MNELYEAIKPELVRMKEIAWNAGYAQAVLDCGMKLSADLKEPIAALLIIQKLSQSHSEKIRGL